MTEAEICAGWYGSPRGYALKDAEELLGGVYVQPAFEPRTYEWICEGFRRSCWYIASLFPQKLAEVGQSMETPPGSRFRAMSSSDVGLHAVVLVGATDERFYYLDPWYRADGQPFSMSTEEFIDAFAGFLVQIPLVEPR